MDQYCFWYCFDSAHPVFPQTCGSLDVHPWLTHLHCSWNCCRYVTNWLFSVPDGFLLLKIVAGIVLIFMGALVAASYVKPEFRKEIFICGRLFEIAAQIVWSYPLILVYIFVWWVFQCGLIALTAFELLSVWSIGPLRFNPESSFYEVGSFISNLLSFLIFVQFIWGLSFLKEAFNFCVGGFATLWYCYED